MNIKKCPKCGKKDKVGRIIYGLVTIGGKQRIRAKEKNVMFGGCVIRPNSPKYHCNRCDSYFGKFKMPQRKTKKKKSNLPMYLQIIGAIVLIIVVFGIYVLLKMNS